MNTKTLPSSRDAYFDNLRLFLMFVVVLCHGLETMRNTSDKIIAIHEVLLSFVMPLFVFVSGYFAKGMAKENSPKRLRILNLVVLYCIAQILKNLIAGYDSFLKPTYGNWFLVGLIVWYTILPLADKLKPALVIITAIVASMFIGIDPHANTVLQTSRVVCFFPFFMLGFYLDKNQIELIKQDTIRRIGCLILLGSIIFCLSVWNHTVPLGIMHADKSYETMKLSIIEGFGMRLGWYALATIMGFGVMSIIPKNHLPITVIGTRTLPIFIIHTLLYLYLSKRIGFFKLLGGISNGYLRLGSVILLSIAIVLICGNKFFAKPFDQFMGYDFRWAMKNKTDE